MTVVTLVAIAVIGAILALMWPRIENSITGLWGTAENNAGYTPGTK
jgi:mannose/fructose/N-acetylgalactosamine-specific phosphotransferase system component IIC